MKALPTARVLLTILVALATGVNAQTDNGEFDIFWNLDQYQLIAILIIIQYYDPSMFLEFTDYDRCRFNVIASFNGVKNDPDTGSLSAPSATDSPAVRGMHWSKNLVVSLARMFRLRPIYSGIQEHLYALFRIASVTAMWHYIKYNARDDPETDHYQRVWWCFFGDRAGRILADAIVLQFPAMAWGNVIAFLAAGTHFGMSLWAALLYYQEDWQMDTATKWQIAYVVYTFFYLINVVLYCIRNAMWYHTPKEDRKAIMDKAWDGKTHEPKIVTGLMDCCRLHQYAAVSKDSSNGGNNDSGKGSKSKRSRRRARDRLGYPTNQNRNKNGGGNS